VLFVRRVDEKRQRHCQEDDVHRHPRNNKDQSRNVGPLVVILFRLKLTSQKVSHPQKAANNVQNYKHKKYHAVFLLTLLEVTLLNNDRCDVHVLSILVHYLQVRVEPLEDLYPDRRVKGGNS